MRANKAVSRIERPFFVTDRITFSSVSSRRTTSNNLKRQVFGMQHEYWVALFSLILNQKDVLLAKECDARSVR